MAIEAFVFPPTIKVSSAEPEPTVTVFLRTDEPQEVSVDLQLRPITGSPLDPVRVYAQPRPAAPFHGCHWPSLSLSLGAAPATGPYGLYCGEANLAAFVVRAAHPSADSPRHLVMLPFATMQAYNPVGDGSFYVIPRKDGNIPRKDTVSWLRPTSPYDEFGRWNTFIEWMRREFPSISLDFCTSLDLHEEETLLDRYSVLYLIGHDEYWSTEMLERIDRFVLGGGNVISMSGNTGFGRVRFSDQRQGDTVYRNAQMSLYLPTVKDTLLAAPESADPRVRAEKRQAFLRGHPTGLFTDWPMPSPQERVLGIGTNHCFWKDAADVSNSRYKIAPLLAEEQGHWKHWALAGVSSSIKEFGTPGLFAHESDAADIEEWEGSGLWCATGRDGAPRNYTVLAHADLRLPQTGKPGFATLGYSTRNGTVFTMSTIHWVDTLGEPTVHQITRNVIQKFQELKDPWFAWDRWERIGDAREVRSLTAGNGWLYAIGLKGALWRPPVAMEVPWLPLERMAGPSELGPMTVAGSQFIAAWGRPNAYDSVARWRRGPDGSFGWVPQRITTPGLDSLQALAAIGQILFAVARFGADERIVWAKADAPESWNELRYPIEGPGRLLALAAQEHVLYAVRDDDKLIRTRTRTATDAFNSWEVLGSAGGVKKLAALETMLYGIDDAGDLRRMDLLHFYVEPRRGT